MNSEFNQPLEIQLEDIIDAARALKKAFHIKRRDSLVVDILNRYKACRERDLNSIPEWSDMIYAERYINTVQIKAVDYILRTLK